MKKQQLTNFIERYALGGEIESVLWTTAAKITTVEFTHPDKTLIGKVQLKSSDLSDSKLGIFETPKLVQMLSVLDSDIDVTLDDAGGKATSIAVKDAKYNMKYVLADDSVIPKPASIKQLPEFDVKIDITSEFINNFLNALKAVTSDTCAFVPNGDKVDIIVGYSSTINQNNIKFTQDAVCSTDKIKIFSSNHIRNILTANRNSTGSISISSNGLMKVAFDSSEFTSEYLLVESQTN